MPKIWVGWTTANREKKEDGLTLKYRIGAIELGNDLFKNLVTGFFYKSTKSPSLLRTWK